MRDPDTTTRAGAEPPLAVALDVGTSSVRAGLYDRLGRRVTGCWSQSRYEMDVTAGGGASVDAGSILDLIERVVDDLVERCGAIAPEARVGAISCFLHSLVGLGERGVPVTSVLAWLDRASAQAADVLRDRIDHRAAHRRTGCAVHVSYWPSKILHLREAGIPCAAWVGLPDLIAERLTGARATTLSHASATGLFDRFRGEWDAELLDVLGLDPSALPVVADEGIPLGSLRAPLRRRWPSLAAVEWFAAWGDALCDNVGTRAVSPERAVLMIGTSGAMRVIVPEPAPAVPFGLFAFRLDAERSLVGGQLSEGAAALSALARLLRRSRRELERLAAARAPDDHGLTMLPFLAGERGVGYHDGAAATITGLSLATHAGQLYRALLEAIAYRFAAVDDLLATVLPRPPDVQASGAALTRSPLWLQITADVLGRGVAVAPTGEASARGAALLALDRRHALDPEAMRPARSPRIVTPDPGRHGVYREARRRQQALYDALYGSRADAI